MNLIILSIQYPQRQRIQFYHSYYDHYYKSYDGKWIDGEYVQKWNGKYNKMTTKGCIYIPNEVERLEYLISYCLKNYYIKQANMIEDGKFVPKWKYEQKCNECENNRRAPEVDIIIDGQRYEVI